MGFQQLHEAHGQNPEHKDYEIVTFCTPISTPIRSLGFSAHIAGVKNRTRFPTSNSLTTRVPFFPTFSFNKETSKKGKSVSLGYPPKGTYCLKIRA